MRKAGCACAAGAFLSRWQKNYPQSCTARKCAVIDFSNILWYNGVRQELVSIYVSRSIEMELNFGENIRRLRRARELTQEELANALGVTAQSVSKWECAYGYPDITQLPAIANFFGVSI